MSYTNETYAARLVEEIAALHPVEREREKLIDRLGLTMYYLSSDYNADEILDLVVRGMSARNLVEPDYEPMTQQEEALDGWVVPDLTERRAIWRNFPVVVKPHALGCADGKDRYDIVWHADNFAAWRNERTESSDEAADYEDWVLWRMDHAFAEYSDIYTLEATDDEDVIYRIAVATEVPKLRALDVLREHGATWKRDGPIHDVRSPAGMSAEAQTALVATLKTCSDCVVLERDGFVCRLIIAADAAAAAAIAAEIAAVPVMTDTVIDVLMRFPVTWVRKGSIHDVKIHFGKCPRKDIPTTTANLLAVLRSRTDCRVERPLSDEFICRVVIQ
jgi:hypothetical protein